MDIVVLEELKAYIEPLTPDEHEALERSLLAEGCRDALVLWDHILVDGHNRYGICQKHGLPFKTVQHPHLKSMEDVHLWMIDQHLGRRSLSDFQRGVLALRKREILGTRKERVLASAAPAAPAAAAPAGDAPWDEGAAPAAAPAAANLPPPQPLNNRAAVARAARLTPAQVQAIEKITQQAAPEVVAAVRSGEITINAAAAVASLPAEEQKAAATAGKDELKQAAKRARELSKPKKDKAAPELPPEAADLDTEGLRAKVAELTAENTRLRERVADLQAALQRATAAG